MDYLRTYYLYLFLLLLNNAVALPQTTANNFTYPQSIFVDSPNGHIWITDFSNHRVLRFDVSSLTPVSESEKLQSPQNFFLSQNYPNPFNEKTQITFSTNSTEDVLLTVYDLLGQKIATLFDEIASANTAYSIAFDAKNLPSGIYLYSLRTEDGYEVKRMCLLK